MRVKFVRWLRRLSVRGKGGSQEGMCSWIHVGGRRNDYLANMCDRGTRSLVSLYMNVLFCLIDRIRFSRQ